MPGLERGLSPRQRSTRALFEGLDERFSHDAGIAGKEWRELRRRLRELMQANARGDSHASAGDVCAYLYLAGLDEPSP